MYDAPGVIAGWRVVCRRRGSPRRYAISSGAWCRPARYNLLPAVAARQASSAAPDSHRSPLYSPEPCPRVARPSPPSSGVARRDADLLLARCPRLCPCAARPVRVAPTPPLLRLLAGIGDVVAGMARQEYDLEL